MTKDERKRLEGRISNLTDDQLTELQKKWQLTSRIATIARAVEEAWKLEQKRKGKRNDQD